MTAEDNHIVAMCGGNRPDLMSSRDLFDLINKAREAAGEGQIRYNDFMARAKNELDGDHYEIFVVQNTNKTNTEIAMLSRDQCMLVSMRESKSVRRSVRDRLNALSAPPVPQTYAAALLEAGRLALELEQAQQQIAIDAPKVEFVDRYVNASGSMGFREVCKILKANEREFKSWLFDTKVMYQLGKSMVPYSAHMDAGRFEIKTGNARHGDNDHAFKQARFTPKGIEWIAGEWGKHKARQVH